MRVGAVSYTHLGQGNGVAFRLEGAALLLLFRQICLQLGSVPESLTLPLGGVQTAAQLLQPGGISGALRLKLGPGQNRTFYRLGQIFCGRATAQLPPESGGFCLAICLRGGQTAGQSALYSDAGILCIGSVGLEGVEMCIRDRNLAFPGQLGKISQGGFHTAVIKGDQGIVQHQRCLLLLGQYQITDGQPHRQIQLVCSSLTQLEGFPGKKRAFFLG